MSKKGVMESVWKKKENLYKNITTIFKNDHAILTPCFIIYTVWVTATLLVLIDI